MSYASLSSIPGSDNENPYIFSELSGISLTSGEYEYVTASLPSDPRYLKSSISQYTGDGATGVEIYSTEKRVVDDELSGVRKAGIDFWLFTDENNQNSSMRIYADSIELLPSNPGFDYDPPLTLGYRFASNDGTGVQLDTGDEYTHIAFSRNETNVTREATTYTVYYSGSGLNAALTANSCYTRFRTGPTGVSQITAFFRTGSNVAAQSAFGSFAIYKYVGTNGSGYPFIGGATLVAASDSRAVQSSGTSAQSASYTYLFQGEPNTSYVVASASKSSSASATATFFSRALTVIPIT
jgi:hypothetical protein